MDKFGHMFPHQAVAAFPHMSKIEEDTVFGFIYDGIGIDIHIPVFPSMLR